MSDTKSESAFRTISEVAQLLDVKPHVLRFWESKFDQIQPMKRANGRRYYRPEDVALISGIQHLLYEQGLTIKGVQKLIKDDGIASVRAQRQSHQQKSNQGTSLTLEQRSQLEAARQSLMQARLLLAD
ncbi:MAG: MerR family transcriptional regulator [Rhodobiaceae bacterium]|nr:MerR family transcriptional regulator [Rhodobiaceae bacterium]